jgi:hypothetical protein
MTQFIKKINTAIKNAIGWSLVNTIVFTSPWYFLLFATLWLISFGILCLRTIKSDESHILKYNILNIKDNTTIMDVKAIGFLIHDI